jgi:hypothetical protein
LRCTDEPRNPGALARPVTRHLAQFGLLVGFPVVWTVDGLWRAAALADPGCQFGIAAQVLASVAALFRLHRTLERRHDDQRILAREFVFVIARWVVVAIAAFTGIAVLLGPRFGGALLIVVHGAASVWFELYPSKAARFLRGRDAARAGDRAGRREGRAGGGARLAQGEEVLAARQAARVSGCGSPAGFCAASVSSAALTARSNRGTGSSSSVARCAASSQASSSGESISACLRERLVKM